MKKTKQNFSFTYKLTQKVVRELKIQTETVGELIVEGVGYFNPNTSPIDVFDRYSVDIDFIKWQGVDIKPVLEVMDGVEDIEEKAIRYFAELVTSKIAA